MAKPAPEPAKRRKTSPSASEYSEQDASDSDGASPDSEDEAEAASPSPCRSQEADDASCIVCGQTDNPAEMLLCDGCDTAGAHHLACLDPPLPAPPEGSWFCPDCLKDQKEREGMLPSLCLDQGAGDKTPETARQESVDVRPCMKIFGRRTLESGQLYIQTEHSSCTEAIAEENDRSPGAHASSSQEEDQEGIALSARPQKFASGRQVNRGALLLEEKAAVRKLAQAEESLKIVEQKSGRAMRALGRKSSRQALDTQQPVSIDTSDDSEVEVPPHPPSPPPQLLSRSHRAQQCPIPCYPTVNKHMQKYSSQVRGHCEVDFSIGLRMTLSKLCAGRRWHWQRL